MHILLLPALLVFLFAASAQGAEMPASVPLPVADITALTFSQSIRQLYLSAGAAVLVLDDKGAEINRLPAHGAAGVVLVPALRRGYILNGATDQAGPELTIFDLGRSVAVAHLPVPLERLAQGVFEPRTTQIFLAGENDRRSQLVAIDAGGVREIGTIALPEKPAALLADGAGRLFLTFPASDEIGILDARRRELIKTWPAGAACHQPGPAALDEIHHRLYVACGNGQLVVMDSDYGAVETSLPASASLDALAYDPSRDRLYAADSGGPVVVVGEGKDGKVSILDALQTDAMTQFLALDGRDQHLYLVGKTDTGAALLIVPSAEIAPDAPQ
jgi:hypothetical protein